MAAACTGTAIMHPSEASGLIGSSPHQAAYQECVYMDVSLVHHTTLVHPSFKLVRHNSPAPSLPVAPSRPMSLRSPSPRPSAHLPDEIFAQIAQYILGNAFCGLDVAQPAPEIRKPSFGDIDGMTRASRRLRAISLPEWFRLFVVGHVNDWDRAGRLNGMHTWVRHIVCPPNALDWPAPNDVLSRFPNLRSASLSLSRDYQFNPTLLSGYGSNIYPRAPATLEVTSGIDYLQPVSAFPSTMTSLSVRSTHGSETPLLHNLGLQCPDLRTLRLGKCTMFDSCTEASGARCDGSDATSRRDNRYSQIADGSQCAFWGAFPFDHDIYFGGEGVEAYASRCRSPLAHAPFSIHRDAYAKWSFVKQDELAAELAPLQNLEEVSLGVYLTPHAALAEHRLAHYPLRHLQPNNDDAPLPNPSTAASQPPILLPQEQPPPPATAAASSVVSPIPLPPPPVTTTTPWSTSQVLPPPYMDSSLWSYDCYACRKIYAAPTAVAERTAGLVLAASLPRLRKIEWASFFESRADPHHHHCDEFRRGTGTHEWRVLRDSCGTVLDVERVF
ncbi:hypothetical protein FRC07_003937 [Ceratobasidium sp. 392]|nr:hypothetical protein FRC07_003937 [Ceratobasidium sp. 392]